MKNLLPVLQQYKYELLLFALVQHLFIGMFLNDLAVYAEVIWPINMVVLGIASIGVFVGKGLWKNLLRNILFILVVALPLGLPFFKTSLNFFLVLNVVYVGYFIFILYEVLRFLVKPSYINRDIISASVCGFLLLVEISTFLFQFFFIQNAESFIGVETANAASTFMDLVYFSSITLTSIGYGDISPSTHHTKLAVSAFGIAGQFYMVVLVGIILSKFSSSQSTN